MNFTEFVKPELLILVPVLYCIGMGVKKNPAVKDWLIPYIIGACGVLLAVLWTLAMSNLASYKDAAMAVFVALTQGVLCAGMSVFANQLGKQWRKGE